MSVIIYGEPSMHKFLAVNIFLNITWCPKNITNCQVPSHVRKLFNDSAGDIEFYQMTLSIRINYFESIILYSFDGFQDNSNFVWPEKGSVARSHRLRATDPFVGKQNCCCPRIQSITVLLYTFIFFKIFLFTLSTHISIRCLQYPRPSSPRIWTTPRHCYVNITWLTEPIKIRSWVNISPGGNRSMNCWLVNITVLQLFCC